MMLDKGKHIFDYEKIKLGKGIYKAKNKNINTQKNKLKTKIKLNAN